MKIVFNLIGTGLGNNGGSKTLIRSAETLRELGEDVSLACQVNRCDWWDIKVPIVNSIPACDVLIATGYGSVKNTIEHKKSKHKIWYVRAHENWMASESDLTKAYRNIKCVVNSQGLQQWLSMRKVASQVLYPGIDFGRYRNQIDKRANILGGLHHGHKRKRSSDCMKVHKLSGYPILRLNRDVKTGDFEELNAFYNRIKVWMSPSDNEGLQNVPIEATLCGCALVLTDHLLGGTSDYAKDNETCLIYPHGNLSAAAECVDKLMKNDALCKLLSSNAATTIKHKIGNRKDNMTKFIAYLHGL